MTQDDGTKNDDKNLWDQVAKTVDPIDRHDVLLPENIQERSATSKTSSKKKAGKVPPATPEKPPRREPSADLNTNIDYGAGLDRRSDNKLKRGQYTIDARIDLHGKIRTEAITALQSFITSSYGQGHRCVLVITGKGKAGQGVLKTEVPIWLSEPPIKHLVLRHYHARAEHGGNGALYVLLKRKKT